MAVPLCSLTRIERNTQTSVFRGSILVDTKGVEKHESGLVSGIWSRVDAAEEPSSSWGSYELVSYNIVLIERNIQRKYYN